MDKTKVLIAESDANTARSIRQALFAQGYVISGIASTADEAYSKAVDLRPDVILLEAHLCGKGDGVGITKKLQDRLSAPIILIVDSVEDLPPKSEMEIVPQGIIVKPFSAQQLQASLELVLHSNARPIEDAKEEESRGIDQGSTRDESFLTREKDRQHWLDTTFHWLSDGVIAADEQGKIRFMNEAAEKMTGWKSEEAAGKSMTFVFQVSDVVGDLSKTAGSKDSIFGSSLMKGARQHTTLTCRDGTEIPVDYSSAMVRDRGRQLEGFVLIFRNATARRRLETMLEKSRKKYKDLVHSVDGIVWESDFQTGQFTFVSKYAERILGYPVGMWMNDPSFFSDHVHLEDRERILQQRSLQKVQQKDLEYEYRMIASDGRTVWLRDRCSILFDKGVPRKLRGLMMDITSRKWMEDTLRESEELFRRTFDSSSAGMALLRTDGRFVRVNGKLCRMLGKEEQEMLRKNLSAFLHPDDLQNMLRNFQSLLHGEPKPYQYACRCLNQSGQAIPTRITCSLIRHHSGRPLYVVAEILEVE